MAWSASSASEGQERSVKIQVVSQDMPGLLKSMSCLLYTSDAADERSSVDLGGRRIIKNKKTNAESSQRMRDIDNKYTHTNKHQDE